jgi:hypothetical protein
MILVEQLECAVAIVCTERVPWESAET